MSLCHVLLGSVLPRIVYMVPGAGVPLLRGQEVQIQPDITNASPFYLFFFTRMSPSFVGVLRQSCFYDGYSCCGGLQSINCYPPLSLLSVVHFRSAEILATAHSGHITELLHLPWAHSTAVGRLLLHVSSEHAGTAGRCA